MDGWTGGLVGRWLMDGQMDGWMNKKMRISKGQAKADAFKEHNFIPAIKSSELTYHYKARVQDEGKTSD